MKTVKLYLKKNGRKKLNDRQPDFSAEIILDQGIHFSSGQPISVGGWLSSENKKLTIYIKPAEVDFKKTEN